MGNNRIFGDNIVNYQTNPHRRVDLTAQLAAGVNPLTAVRLLQARVAQVPNVAKDPAPEVEILEFNALGTKLVVRPYCANAHYWQVYFDTNKAILLAGAEAGWPVPAPQQVVRLFVQRPASRPARGTSDDAMAPHPGGRATSAQPTAAPAARPVEGFEPSRTAVQKRNEPPPSTFHVDTVNRATRDGGYLDAAAVDRQYEKQSKEMKCRTVNGAVICG